MQWERVEPAGLHLGRAVRPMVWVPFGLHCGSLVVVVVEGAVFFMESVVVSIVSGSGSTESARGLLCFEVEVGLVAGSLFIEVVVSAESGPSLFSLHCGSSVSMICCIISMC